MEPGWLIEDSGEASGWTAGISSPIEAKIFLFPAVSILAVRPCKPLPDEYRSYISAGKTAVRLLPSRAEDKKEWSYTSIASHVFLSWWLSRGQTVLTHVMIIVRLGLQAAAAGEENEHVFVWPEQETVGLVGVSALYELRSSLRWTLVF